MIRFFTFRGEGLISVWDLSTERRKVLRPFGAVPLVVVCVSAKCKAGSDEEEGKAGAEEFDGVSTSIAMISDLSSWGLVWVRSQRNNPLKYAVSKAVTKSCAKEEFDYIPHDSSLPVLYIRDSACLPSRRLGAYHDTGRAPSGWRPGTSTVSYVS